MVRVELEISQVRTTSICCSSVNWLILHGKENALIFTSGYVSNWAALGTLGARIPDVVILSDELNHASMIEGIRHSRAKKVLWRHNDPEDLDRKLSALPVDCPKIVAFESVYSMDGDICPMKEIVEVAEKTWRYDIP